MTDLQIRYFLKIAQCMSYTGAARELFVTQPSLSKQIGALERELGVELFDRSCRSRLSLTPAGKLFQKTFQESAQAFQDTVRQVQLQQTERAMELRIGIGAGWDWGELTVRCGEAIRAHWPEARLSWRSHSFLTLRRALAANALDMIFCVQTGLDSFEGIQVRPVLDAEATVYYSAAHGAVQNIQELRNEPLYVLPQEEAPLSTEINRGYFSLLNVRPMTETLPNRESILLALSGGRGFAVFDNMMTARENRCYAFLPLGSPIPICAVSKEQNRTALIEPVVDWMRRELRRKFGG